jgi:hypothetical protein
MFVWAKKIGVSNMEWCTPGAREANPFAAFRRCDCPSGGTGSAARPIWHSKPFKSVRAGRVTSCSTIEAS